MESIVTAELNAKKQQILKIAQRCFARYGFAKTTLDDIAAGVGVKKASLYYYYENKEAIFRDVIRLESYGILRQLKQIVDEAASPTAKLFAFARAEVDLFRDYINLHDLSVQVILEVKPLIDKLYEDFRHQQMEILTEVLETGIANGVFRKLEPPKVAHAILIILESIKFKTFQSAAFHSATEIDYSKLQMEIDFILGLLVDGIKQT